MNDLSISTLNPLDIFPEKQTLGTCFDTHPNYNFSSHIINLNCVPVQGMNSPSMHASQAFDSSCSFTDKRMPPHLTQLKREGFLYKRSDHLKRWRKRYLICDGTFLKLSHNIDGKNMKIIDLKNYSLEWKGKTKDKYVLTFRIRSGVKPKTPKIVLSSTDEGLAKDWHIFFLTEPPMPQIDSISAIEARTRSVSSRKRQESESGIPEETKQEPGLVKMETMPNLNAQPKRRPSSVMGERDVGKIADSDVADFTDNSQDISTITTLKIPKISALEQRSMVDNEGKVLIPQPKANEYGLPREAPKWVEELFNKYIKENKLWKKNVEDSGDKDEWNLLQNDSRLRIMQSKTKQDVYRCRYAFEAGATKEKILQILLDVQNRDKWDPSFQKASTVSYIHATKQCIIHQVNKSFGILYLPRELLYTRYVYRTLDSYFILDKSLNEEQLNIQKSLKCPRGNIEYSKNSGQVHLNMLLSMTNGGLLSYPQEAQITSQSLAGLKNIHNIFDQYEGWDEFELDFMPSADVPFSQQDNTILEQPEDSTLLEQSVIKPLPQQMIESGSNSDSSNTSPISPVLDRAELESVFNKNKPEEESKIAVEHLQHQNDESPIIEGDLFALIERVRSDLITADCVNKRLKNRKLTEAEINAIITDAENDILNGKTWVRDPANGLRFTDEEFLSKQKKVLGHFLRSMGKNFLEGKSIMSVSMPVTIFSNETMLQRCCSAFGYAPSLLTLAGQQQDKLEAFKYVLAFYFSTLHTAIGQSKPFNPILGETYQGFLNGIPVLCEQTSHHPPISAVYMRTNDFFLHGNQQLEASLGANSATAVHKRRLCVTLPKLNMEIYAYFPIAAVSGTTFGKRTFNWTKKMKVYDPLHNLYSEMHFNPEEKGAISGLFSKRTMDADIAKGNICRVDPGFMQALHKKESTLNTDARAKFNPKEHMMDDLASVEGSWISYLEIDNKRYWDIERMKSYKLIDQPTKALPSDSCFREDLIFMKVGDLKKAQEAKDKLENIQRGDKKQREKSGKSKH